MLMVCYNYKMLNLTLRQLQVFDKVASRLNYSRAAEELYLSQPAVSMQIKQLEGVIGLHLFEQMGKKVFLTQAGRELFHYSRSIAVQLNEMEQLFNEMKGLGQGKLTLSVVNTANYFTPQLLAKFCLQHPKLNVSLQVANRDAVFKHLSDNSTDLAIMGQPPEGLDVSKTAFMDNLLVVIAAPDHPLAIQQRIKLKQLASETFLSREPGSGTRSAMERVFAEHRIAPRISMEMETNEAVKQAVQAGMGLGILSRHCIELELETERLVILDVEHFPLLRHWYVVYRSHKRLSSAAQAFRNFLLEETGYEQNL
jgi:LysR family transcriptional regulator, low CO2-responsive transcriptional regulator